METTPTTTGRPAPGTVNVPGREFLYVSDDGGDFPSLFERLTTFANPPAAKSGGAITENCRLRLLDGRTFHAISFRGDLDGWRLDIERSAKALGLQIGKIVDSHFIPSDGQPIPLADCTVYLY